ncbi:MAG: energy-coupling factor transporter ATPase [Nitrososphaerota archaeon]
MEPVIEIEDLWWRYEYSKDWVLKGINLKINPEEFVVITGPNDSGKSSLVSTFNGLIPHSQRGAMKGRVRVLGQDTASTEVAALCAFVGMTFQDPETQFLLSRVDEEVAFGPQNLGYRPEEVRDKVSWALEMTRLSEFRMKDPVELSGGQKQRTALAATLAMSPKVMVLDEPTSMLDPIGKDEIMEIITSMKRQRLVETIIVVEHHLEELARIADRFILLKDGEILLDAPTEKFFSDPDFLIENGVRVPDVCAISGYLKKRNLLGNITLSLEEAVESLARLFSERRIMPNKKRTDTRMPPAHLGDETAVEVDNLHYVYPDGTVALRGLDLKIRKGEFIALIGQNGSGKTTLSKLIAGIYKPTSGSVKIFGMDTRVTPTPRLISKVGYVFQNPDHQIFNDTIRKELEFGLRNLLSFGLVKEEEIEQRIRESIKITGVPEDILDEHPFLMSKGMRQRIAVASVLAMKPDVLIVDEPTTGQDTPQSIDVMNFLQRLNEMGHTIIIITHEMWIVARWARRTIALAEGKILLDGPTNEVLSNTEVLKKTFVRPTQVTLLSQSLREYGMPGDILTVDEFMNSIEVS